jgi:hypothetical protein
MIEGVDEEGAFSRQLDASAADADALGPSVIH